MNDWSSVASLDTLKARQKLLSEIRQYFAKENVLEVETPVLSRSGNSDPNLKQFFTGDKSKSWLRTSPEYAMKRLLASGCGDIFELGRVFRDGEQGRLHNPEFTLLEWYRTGWGYQQLMQEVVALVNRCGALFNQNWQAIEVTYSDLFKATLGINPLTANRESLMGLAKANGINVHSPETLERDDWLDILMSQVVQPGFAEDCMTLVHHYPASQAALARIPADNPDVSERFEVFVGSVELANGYGELTDHREQQNRFEAENIKRENRGDPSVKLDYRLLGALEHGLPECSGVALGVDRLLMVCLQITDIRKLIAFPSERA